MSETATAPPDEPRYKEDTAMTCEDCKGREISDKIDIIERIGHDNSIELEKIKAILSAVVFQMLQDMNQSEPTYQSLSRALAIALGKRDSTKVFTIEGGSIFTATD